VSSKVKQVCRMEEALGVAGEKKSVAREQRRELLEHLALRRLVEVDHHVPAKDRIEGTAHGPLRIQPIELTEGHTIAALLSHPHAARAAAGAFQKKALQLVAAKLRHTLIAVDARGRL